MKPNFTECIEVCFTQNRKNRCPIHKIIFEKRIFSLKYYSDKEKTKIEEYITVGLLYCISCKKAFIDNDISEEIGKKVPIKKIRIVPTRSDNDNEVTMGLFRNKNYNQVTKKAQSSNSKNSMRVMQLDKNDISYYPTFGGKSNNQSVNKHDKKYENNLSEESDLKKLGYNIGLSREARWNILKNKAIKKLGIDKTISHISFLINLNKDKINKDYSRALEEWRYDLRRLKALL